ncbi:MAG: NAD(P)H-dependent oxidoreductase [Nitriliruptor sp.]|uniref:flavodoxin family protein n=1 Tax=Nitriliruptor sp. TaxID=2448056 RepID=UPI0034A06DE3
MTDLTCLALNCSLKPDGPSNTQILLDQLLDQLSGHGVSSETVRLAAHDVKPGVEADMGDGDDWPSIRERILAADILLIATPVWLGNPSSVARRALERCDAFIAETDDAGRMVTFGKVGGAVVTGNEDGAHNCIAQIYQGLSDCGFTIPQNAATYWVGEAMQPVDYGELEAPPENVASTTKLAAASLAHVASLLAANPYPPLS